MKKRSIAKDSFDYATLILFGRIRKWSSILFYIFRKGFYWFIKKLRIIMLYLVVFHFGYHYYIDLFIIFLENLRLVYNKVNWFFFYIYNSKISQLIFYIFCQHIRLFFKLLNYTNIFPNTVFYEKNFIFFVKYIKIVISEKFVKYLRYLIPRLFFRSVFYKYIFVIYMGVNKWFLYIYNFSLILFSKILVSITGVFYLFYSIISFF